MVAALSLVILTAKGPLRPVWFKRAGRTYEASINPHAARPLEVRLKGHLVTRYLFKEYQPWRLELAKAADDGREYLAIGVVRKTKYLPFPHRTLFILDFDGHEVVRKWTGSTMGRPLLDFCFVAPKPHRPRGKQGKPTSDVLVTLEERLDGSGEVSAHRWNGFGFTRCGHPVDAPIGAALRASADAVILQTGGIPKTITLQKLL